MPKSLYTLILLFTLLVSPLLHAEPQGCQVDLDQLTWAKAEYATSGDTVVIQNQKVRLIGLYAPQRGKKQKFNTPGDPLAEEAQLFLNRLLANNNLEVGIEYDRTRIDNRNRHLAHLFLRDGTSIQQTLLENGYALNHTTYNNTQHANCYYQAEQKARQGQYQLWDFAAKYPDRNFPLAESDQLTTEDEGFRIIRGKIETVERSSTNYIINMDTTGIRVPKKHWDQFDYNQLKALQGQTIEVRGFAFLFNKAMYVVIDHPYAINVFNPVGE